MKQISAVLAGNPNVGKSTVFNGLTGLSQHTGNWSGKTVSCAEGTFSCSDTVCTVTDLPGIYSLRTHSEEENIARTCICSSHPDILIVVGDATCLERGLHLLKQITQLPDLSQTALMFCVNLCDEAEKNGILIDFLQLEKLLGIPVFDCVARNRKRIELLKERIVLEATQAGRHPDPDFSPEEITRQTVQYTKKNYRKRQGQLDRFLTGRITGSLVMIFLLLIVFWITITGANYPSAFLWEQFFHLELWMAKTFQEAGVPGWLTEALVSGVYRSVAWIVSVMLPPMAIFFPLFTLLEDLGYLPRAAFNMDCAFKKCHACGKQCLTMCVVTAPVSKELSVRSFSFLTDSLPFSKEIPLKMRQTSSGAVMTIESSLTVVIHCLL